MHRQNYDLFRYMEYEINDIVQKTRSRLIFIAIAIKIA